MILNHGHQAEQAPHLAVCDCPLPCFLEKILSDYDLPEYNFALPDSLIASHPPENRGDSRLMVLARNGLVPPRDAMFCDLPSYLPKDALLVANNSRVLPARLRGKRESGGKVEFLLLSPLPLILKNAAASSRRGIFSQEAECLLRAGGKIRIGEIIEFGENFSVEVLAKGEYGKCWVKLSWRGNLEDIFANGEIPLPPYLRRKAENGDKTRYKTVYGSPEKTGSVAAPTAGLHFTEEMKNRLLGLGFGWTELTLYVGYGTFSPVRCQDIRKHAMHPEYVEISADCANTIRQAKADGRPIVAVGTTSMRAMEGVAQKTGEIGPWQDWLNIFIYPGKRFKVATGLLTNFHLPESTLLMLVSAFANRQYVLDAYAMAVERKYRFFSYGDAMLIS